MEIIYGKYQNSLETEVFERIRDCLLNKKKTFVFVPSQASFLMESQILKRLNIKGFMTLEVLSFEKFTENILERASGRTLPFISASGASMLVKCAMEAVKDQLSIIDEEADPFIHQYLSQAISTYRAENITPEMLRLRAEAESGVTALKLNDISIIYEKVSSYLTDHLFDAKSLEAYAKEQIKYSSYAKDATILVTGFNAIPCTRIQTLMELEKIGANVTIAMEAEYGQSIFEKQIKMIDTIEHIAKEEGVSIIKKEVTSKRNMPKEIAHLEDQLFSFPLKPYQEKPTNILILNEKTKEKEVASVAELILEEVCEKGLKLSDIGILLSDPASYEPVLTDVFSRTGIAYFFEGKRQALEHRAATLVLSALDIIVENKWKLFDVFRYLKTGLLPLSLEEADNLIVYAKEHGLKGHAFQTELHDPEAEEWRSKAFSALIDFQTSVKRKDASVTASCLLSYLEALHVEEQLEQEAEALTLLGLSAEARYVSQVYQIICDNLKQAELLLKGVPKKELRSVLFAGLQSVSVAVVPPCTDEVIVGDIMHSIVSFKKVIIILGANNGLLPKESSGGIFSDYEIRKLNQNGFFPGELPENQPLFIRRAFASAEKLILSYNLEAGSPSLYIDKIKRIFPKIEEQSTIPLRSLKGGLLSLAQEMRRIEDGEALEPIYLPMYENHEEGKAYIRALTARLHEQNIPKALSKETAACLYKNASANISRIEEYYQCPYRQYLNFGIRPKQEKEFEESAKDAGSYVHSMMEEITKKTLRQNKNIRDLSDEALALLVEEAATIQRECHNNGIFKESKRFQVVEERLKQEILFALKGVRNHFQNTQVSIKDIELAFGKQEGITIETENGSILVKGKIDRIDSLKRGEEEYIRIVDYKTSDKEFNIGELYYGVNIQLFVYLLSALTLFEGVIPAGGFYFNITLPYLEEGQDREEEYRMSGFFIEDSEVAKSFDGEEGGKMKSMQLQLKKDGNFYASSMVFAPSEMNKLLDYVKTLIANAMNEMQSGVLKKSPYSGKKDACTYCAYRSICRFDEHFAGNRKNRATITTRKQVLGEL